MSLVPFHRLLIAVAIIFCAGFAAWELRAFLNDGEVIDLALAIAFAAAAAGFGYYLRHLRRFLGLARSQDATGGK
jgi:hypothetical protein